MGKVPLDLLFEELEQSYLIQLSVLDKSILDWVQSSIKLTRSGGFLTEPGYSLFISNKILTLTGIRDVP